MRGLVSMPLQVALVVLSAVGATVSNGWPSRVAMALALAINAFILGSESHRRFIWKHIREQLAAPAAGAST